MIEILGEQYLSAAEASELLGIKPATLYAYVSRGVLRSYRQGIKRQRLYRRRDVEAVLAIKRLLYDEGYRIDGAKRRLRELAGEEPAVELRALADSVRAALAELEKIVDDDERS